LEIYQVLLKNKTEKMRIHKLYIQHLPWNGWLAITPQILAAVSWAVWNF